PHHDPECEIDDRNRRALIGRKVFEAFDLAIPRMGQIKAREVWNLQLTKVAFGRRIRPADKRCGHAAAAIPEPLDRGELGGGSLERAQPFQAPEHNLCRSEKAQKPQGGPQHHAPPGQLLPPPDRVGADAEHDESRRYVEGADRVRQTVWKRWTE